MLEIDGCLRKVVPASRRERIVHAEDYPPIAKHLGERCMHDMIQKKCFRPLMANDVNQKVSHYGI